MSGQKAAGFYLKDNDLIGVAEWQTVAGVWLSEGLAAKVGIDDDGAVAHLIRAVVEDSRTGVPHPSSWTGGFDRIAKLGGATSWKSFVAGRLCVNLVFEEGRYVMSPTSNLGAREGFAPAAADPVVTAGETDLALAEAVRDAFAVSSVRAEGA